MFKNAYRLKVVLCLVLGLLPFTQAFALVVPDVDTADHLPRFQEGRAGTYAQPRLHQEPAWQGAVYVKPLESGRRYFFIAKFDAVEGASNPEFPEGPTSNEFWEFEGSHSGVGPDLKAFDEPTYKGALHRVSLTVTSSGPPGQAETVKALLASKFTGIPDGSTPYPTAPQSNDFWLYVGQFKESGALTGLKDEHDLVWPGVFVKRPDGGVYQALQTGTPSEENWPAPDDRDGKNFWRFAGTDQAAGSLEDAKSGSEVARLGSWFYVEDSPRSRRYFTANFEGIPDWLGAAFPKGEGSNEFWVYKGHHLGTDADPKGDDEPTWENAIHLARIQGKLVQLKSKVYDGHASNHPYPAVLEDNNGWKVFTLSDHAGTYADPKGSLEPTWRNAIHAVPANGGYHLYRRLKLSITGMPPEGGWIYPAPGVGNDEWQYIGLSVHAGTPEDPKGESEYTWPGAIHRAQVQGQTLLLVSTVEGTPTQGERPLPSSGVSNDDWIVVTPNSGRGSYASPNQWNDFAHHGDVYLDVQGTERRFFVAQFDGFPNRTTDAYPLGANSNVYWAYAGKHSGVGYDLKHSDEPTYPGALHAAVIEGQQVLLSAKFDGLAAIGRPYPPLGQSNEHWTFHGQYERTGAPGDLKGTTDFTWPGTLHLDESQMLVWRSRQEGIAPVGGWIYPQRQPGEDEEPENEHWGFQGAMARKGTYEAPQSAAAYISRGAIVFKPTGPFTQEFYEAKFEGFADDLQAAFPAEHENNRFFEYRGEHAGTAADPKNWDEVSYPGAFHLAQWVNGQGMAQWCFYIADESGLPPAAQSPPYQPCDSLPGRAYSFDHRGNGSDPRGIGDLQQTWAGLVHERSVPGGAEVWLALQSGNTAGWPLPGEAGADAYWQFEGRREHVGSFSSPKNASEWTWAGAIHAQSFEGQPHFYRALFTGAPNEEAFPAPGVSSEKWHYLGPANHPAGTLADPAGFTGFTLPGRVHAKDDRGLRTYYRSKVDGLLSEHDWPLPEPPQTENAAWSLLGTATHAGTLMDPKQDEVSWTGAIHTTEVGGVRYYFKNRQETESGVLPERLPNSPISTAHWEYLGERRHAGSFSDPILNGELIHTGAIHARRTEEDRYAYYAALFEGVVDTAQQPYPEGATSNEFWALQAMSHAGSLAEPNDEYDYSWPGAVHRVQRGEGYAYFESGVAGKAPDGGWQFPQEEEARGEWRYLFSGRHLGTYADPKQGDEVTWPGAVHAYRGEHDFLVFFRSKTSGLPESGLQDYLDDQKWELLGFNKSGTFASPNSLYGMQWPGAISVLVGVGKYTYFRTIKGGPLASGDERNFEQLGAAFHTGLMSDPKVWTDFTTVGDVHQYDVSETKLFFRALFNGSPEQLLAYYPTGAYSNDHWAFIGEGVHRGTLEDPKGLDEVTWHGALHMIDRNGRKVYYSARRSGVPGQEGWPYPEAEQNDENWFFYGYMAHAGDFSDPKLAGELVLVDEVVAHNASYYRALVAGKLAPQNLPAVDHSNDYYRFLGRNVHEGTPEDPKGWSEVTWPGAVHRHGHLGVQYLYVSKVTGVPSSNNWEYPGPEGENDYWKLLEEVVDNSADNPYGPCHYVRDGDYAYYAVDSRYSLYRARYQGYPCTPIDPSKPDLGDATPKARSSDSRWEFLGGNTGTMQRPKRRDDPATLGDIFIENTSSGTFYFKAKSDFTLPLPPFPGLTNDYNDTNWQLEARHAGTLDDPKEWTDATWVGDVHRDNSTDQSFFFEAKQDGRPSEFGWHYPAGETDNSHWRSLGRHAGTFGDPKPRLEFTWPGAIHISEENAGPINYFKSRFTGVAEPYMMYPAPGSSNAYWEYLKSTEETAPGITDFSKRFDQYTWVAAHNAFLNSMTDQLKRGVRGFMLDVHHVLNHEFPYGNKPGLYLCHTKADPCSDADLTLSGALNTVFLPFLQQNPNAVITILLENSGTRDELVWEFLSAPELSKMIYVGGSDKKWPTLQEMISAGKRVVVFSDYRGGRYSGALEFDIRDNRTSLVENVYDLGWNNLSDNWDCSPRAESPPLYERFTASAGAFPRLFVMNQFHGVIKSEAHAGDRDNNLTFLQRRVESHCAGLSHHRIPNFIAIDYSQVGDALPYAAALTQGGIYAYEHNGGDKNGDTVCVIPGGVTRDMKLASGGCENDEIRSVGLRGLAAGTRIEFYDSPAASEEDDFTFIEIKNTIPLDKEVIVGSLEGDQENFWYRKTAFHNNGLDGKVSRVKVLPNSGVGTAPPRIVMYEGNSGTQNIVCTIPLNWERRMQMGRSNPYGCDNDEIRSAVLYNVSNAYIELTGDPSGAWGQGATQISVENGNKGKRLIGTFDANWQDPVVEIIKHNSKNIDGKISYGTFLHW